MMLGFQICLTGKTLIKMGYVLARRSWIFTHQTQNLEHSSDLILFKWVNVISCDPVTVSYISAPSKIFSGDSKKALMEAV